MPNPTTSFAHHTIWIRTGDAVEGQCLNAAGSIADHVLWDSHAARKLTVRPPAISGVIAAGLVTLFYLKVGRPRVLNWGATPEEAVRPMPGDELLPGTPLQATRAITIDAPPPAIWPWLVQMGPRPRAGAYTYDWIERLFGIDIENADRILPELQQLNVGDALGMNAKGEGIVVRKIQPERFLVLQWIPAHSTWTFGLYPLDGGKTRLVSRNRIAGAGPLFWVGMVGFMEPGSLIMEREMLRGIKRRTEAWPSPSS
jgi:hypothetical protein